MVVVLGSMACHLLVSFALTNLANDAGLLSPIAKGQTATSLWLWALALLVPALDARASKVPRSFVVTHR